MVQVPLYKSLVSFDIANTRLSDELKFADTIHIPRFGDLSAQTYTPGTPLSATNQDYTSNPVLAKSFLNTVKLLINLTLSSIHNRMIVYETS